MFLRLLELLFLVLVFIMVSTQVILPLWQNRPLFPIFGRRRKVETQLGKVVEEREVNELEKRVHDLHKSPPSSTREK